jgi:hypothetical protein
MPPDDLARLCRRNPGRPRYGRRAAGNLWACGHVGEAGHRPPSGKACQARSSEFRGTPLFNAALPHAKVRAILQHLAEGCGARQTARLVGVNKDTVTRLALVAGEHAEATHDEVVAFSPLDPRGPAR